MCCTLCAYIGNRLVLLIAGVMGDNLVLSGLKCNLSVVMVIDSKLISTQSLNNLEPIKQLISQYVLCAL